MEIDRRKFLRTNATAAGSALLAGAFRPLAAEEFALALTESEKTALWEGARRVFEQSRECVDGKVFHYPSAGNYHSFFAWDSGANVIAGKHLFPEDALKELETIYSFQSPSGKVPHEVRFRGLKEKDPLRNVTIYLLRRQFDRNGVTALIDPPNFIYAVADYFDFTGDRRVLPLAEKAEKAADYLLFERDLFGDGLVSIIHPWESGTDAAAVFDQPIGVSARYSSPAIPYLAKYLQLLNRLAEVGFDPKTVARENIFVFEDVGFNSWLALGLLGLARLFEKTGDKARAKKYFSRAKDMVGAMEKIMWDEQAGFFYPRYDLRKPKLSRRKCAGGMLPMMTGLVSPDKARRLIDEHLKNPAEFNTTYPVSFNAADELAGDHLTLETMMLWRGHCLWANINWALALAAEQYGEKNFSRELALKTARLVLREGFREFYDTRSGKGQGAKNFTWPALVIDSINRLSI